MMSPLCIAIIEDEIAHLSLMKRAILKAFNSAEIHHFEDAATCLETIDQINPGIIISDYLMPGMNGIDLLEAVNGRGLDIPVIIITGQGGEDIAVRAMKLGAWDYLVKSADFFTLLPSVIEKVIREKETKDLLREAEEKYRLVVDNAGEGIMVEQAQMVKFYNPRFAEIFGYKMEEFTSGSLMDIVYPEDKSMVAEYLVKLITDGHKPVTCDFRIISADGQLKWLSNNAVQINWGGRPASLNFLSDITERKRTEKRIQSLTHELIRAQERERSTIARELHDTTLQDLVALKLKTDMLLFDQEELPAKVRQWTKEQSDILQQAITSLRNLAYDLHPAGLKQWGLVKTLDNCCHDFSERNGTNVTFNSSGTQALTIGPEAEINLYRLVQEGLNNIRKHADASNVKISMVADPHEIILTIEDDGKGFDVDEREQASIAEKRLGLRSMKERVSLLGGEIKIESYYGKGTKLLIKVPIGG